MKQYGTHLDMLGDSKIQSRAYEEDKLWFFLYLCIFIVLNYSNILRDIKNSSLIIDYKEELLLSKYLFYTFAQIPHFSNIHWLLLGFVGEIAYSLTCPVLLSF